MILAQAASSLFDWDWVGRNIDSIWRRTVEHLALTGVALVAGIVIASALAAVAIRKPRTYPTITAATGLLYTIPALAVFALVAPLVGIGTVTQRFITAEIALISYTLLILIRNIVTGVNGVPAGVREAAAGMGYSEGERIRQIELPLALPAVMAGIRIATVTVIGLVTVTSLLGLGGLGFFILDGLRRSIIFPTEIIVGVVLSVALAAALDIGLLGIGRVLTPWAREGDR
ncbi:MAG TPA: ABC transporter permease [Acidimicrobiia bacterium]|nr:ABC transporter permease [Acidimicrobiia bacterium]